MATRTIDLVLRAKESRLPGDFMVYRALPRREVRRVGGFVFLDHFDEQGVTGEVFDVPPHPHVGLQTVTYLLEGEILHTDSLDFEQTITPGDVNWMTAGSGITHAEQVITPQRRLHGIQSWVGLPHNDRKVEPAFEHFSRSTLPVVSSADHVISVIAGECFGKESPIPTFQKLVYLDVAAKPGAEIEFPVDPSHELAVYVCEGSIQIAGKEVGGHDLALLSRGDRLALSSAAGSRFILLGGEPLPDPTVIFWNFITDTIGEAKQTLIDWETGKFPKVGKYVKRTLTNSDDEMKKMNLL